MLLDNPKLMKNTMMSKKDTFTRILLMLDPKVFQTKDQMKWRNVTNRWDQGWTTSVWSRSSPVQCVGPTFFEMESDRTDRRLNLDRTDFRPIQKELGPTDLGPKPDVA